MSGNKKLFFIMIFALTGLLSSAQKQNSSGGKQAVLNSNSGYVNINELHYGFGLYTTTEPYSRQYYGISTLHGYQLNINSLYKNRSLLVLAGGGVFFYDEGALIPLYLDLRFIWNYYKVSPFVYGDAGFLIDYNDFFNGTKMFINPGAGAKFRLSRTLSATLEAGLMVQMGESVSRSSFVNMKAGLVLKF